MIGLFEDLKIPLQEGGNTELQPHHLGGKRRRKSRKSSSTNICFDESVTISVSGVPQTAQDFALLNPTFEMFLEDYDGSFYFLKKESMTWENAYNLIQSLGPGASMYVINSSAEEEAVYNKLNQLGYAGVNNVNDTHYNTHFWLGLKQYPALFCHEMNLRKI